MNYLQGFGASDSQYYDPNTGQFYDVATCSPIATSDAINVVAYEIPTSCGGSGSTTPAPDTKAVDWLSTIPIIGNFLVQTGIVHPSPKGYGVPPPGGFKQPTSNLTTYMIIGGIGIGGLLLVKMLMKKS